MEKPLRALNGLQLSCLDKKSLECLPDDVFARILSYLPKILLVRLSIVNSRWYRICYDASLWRNICVPFDYRHNFSDRILMKLTAYSRNVNKLCFVECVNLSDDSLCFISEHCPNMKKLQLCGCVQITDIGMMHIARRSTKLRKLGIAKTMITNKSLNVLLQNNLFLTSLEASTQACTVDTFKALKRCKNFQKLKVYEISEEVLVKDDHIYLDDEMLEAIGKSCPNLTHLALIYDNVEITDSSVGVLGKGSPLLRTVEIDSCPFVGDDGVRALLENCSLEQLHLGESKITDATLCRIAKYLPMIRSLKLEHSDITDFGMIQLMEHCKYLEELSVGVKEPGNITDITACIMCCYSGPYLCSLEFNSCAISDRGLSILANNSILLTSLCLKSCTKITFDGLMSCLKHCQGLQLLDVSFSGLVKSTEHLMDIASILPNLCSLAAVDVNCMSDQDLELFHSLYPLVEVRL